MGHAGEGDSVRIVAGSGGFEALYRAERARTLAVVLALRGPRVGVEEVVQEAFVRALQRWEQVSAMERPDLWVHRVALNLATSRLRRLGAETRALVRLGGRAATAALEMDAGAEDFWRLVRSLPRRQAEAVVLRYAADLPVVEIAEVMDCAPGTVKSHLHAARESLRRELTGGTDDQS